MEKTVGRYQIKFKSSFDEADENRVFLKIVVSDNLKELIKSVAVTDETTNHEYRSGYDDSDSPVYDNLIRYKVKTVIWNALYSRDREFLFEKSLVDNGETVIKFFSLDKRDEAQKNLKNAFKTLVQTVDRVDVDETMTLNVRRSEDEN